MKLILKYELRKITNFTGHFNTSLNNLYKSDEGN
jgi:hypothetical protein